MFFPNNAYISSMILISHRGNLNGPDEPGENTPSSIDVALSMGLDVEVDVRVLNGSVFLGHDDPSTKVDMDWILTRSPRLWIHCKNMQAMEFFSESGCNYFWHQEDDCTLTSLGFIWTYPGKPLSSKSIAVLPEIWTDDLDLRCAGVCSDFVSRWISKNPTP
jgi:hypothetical protein